MVELCMVRESIWFDQRKFENAETRYHEILAARHSGLKIEGTAVATSGSSSSRISNQIQQAKERIRQSLETTPTASSSDMEKRIARVEDDNKQLRSTVDSLLARLSALEAQVRGKGETKVIKAAPAGEEDEDDDFELFGSDDEEAGQEAEQLKQERVEQYVAKKKKKPATVAKSSILLEVKPWDDETDVKEIEKHVREIVADGLLWGASKFVPVAYGIKKLQISCVVEDDKIGTDFLEESITAFDELVQSVDIVAFNKI